MAQLVRAPPCHGGGRRFESDLGRLCYIKRGLSSAGRASALQAEGHRFEPYRPHFIHKIYYLLRVVRAIKDRFAMGAHFILRNSPASGSLLNINADVAQLAEQLICNQQVIGSSPIIGFTGFLPVILKKRS